VIIKLVGQLCSSARAEGGTTIVVLTQREKLEMEDLFRYGYGPLWWQTQIWELKPKRLGQVWSWVHGPHCKAWPFKGLGQVE
jgi:hypothetical protein